METLQLAKAVQNGEADPLQIYIELKKQELELKEALSIVQPLAVSEADKYPGKEIRFADAVVEKRSGPSTWEYKHIPAWNSAKAYLDHVQKIAQAGGGATTQGEEVERAYKIEGRSTIAVTLKKQEA